MYVCLFFGSQLHTKPNDRIFENFTGQGIPLNFMSHPDVGIFEGILPLRHIGMLKAPHRASWVEQQSKNTELANFKLNELKAALALSEYSFVYTFLFIQPH